MIELLHAYNKEGQLVKTQERKSLLDEIMDVSSKSGDAHLAVPVFNLMLTNPRGELYIVQRGNKSNDPFLYGQTAGGHIKAGESYISCLMREANEEVGVHVIVADMFDYHDVVRATDLTKHAVVRLIDFNPWHQIRVTLRGGGAPWHKRDRVVIYAGMYNGKLTYKDGEAINCLMLTPEQLKEEMRRKSTKFTHEFEVLLKRYDSFFKPT